MEMSDELLIEEDANAERVRSLLFEAAVVGTGPKVETVRMFLSAVMVDRGLETLGLGLQEMSLVEGDDTKALREMIAGYRQQLEEIKGFLGVLTEKMGTRDMILDAAMGGRDVD